MKHLITVLLAVSFTVQAYSQCVIDNNPTNPGIYPALLPSGCVGKPYDATTTLVFPSDTVLFGFTVPLDSVIYVVSNVPAGLTSVCHNVNCTIIGNPPNAPRGCVGFSGVPTTATGIGHTVTIDATIYATVPFLGVQSFSIPLSVGLTVFNNPDVSVSTTPTTLTANEMVATYQWLDCNNGFTPINGETSAAFSPSASGNYAVEVSSPSGCVDTSSCVAFTAAASIGESVFSAYRIYPNPVKEQFIISLEQPAEQAHVAIYTATGMLISEHDYTNITTIESRISGETGIYFIQLTVDGQMARSKIIRY